MTLAVGDDVTLAVGVGVAVDVGGVLGFATDDCFGLALGVALGLVAVDVASA